MKEKEDKLDKYLEAEIDLREIFFILWQRKITVFYLTIASTFLFLIYSLSLPNLYTSKAIVEIVDSQDNSSTLSSLSNQFGGLASLAGINLGASQSGGKSFWVIERIKSKDFSERISNLPGMKEGLFAVDRYDQVSKNLIYNEDVFLDSKWVKDNEGKTKKPTSLDFYDQMQGGLLIQKNTETGFIEMSFTHQSPIFASNFLETIINEINDQTRAEEKKAAQDSLNYLKSTLATTSVQEIKNSLSVLIENQTRALMLADISEFYIVKPIDPPFIPENKSMPSRSVISVMGLLFGLLFGASFVILKFYYRKN